MFSRIEYAAWLAKSPNNVHYMISITGDFHAKAFWCSIGCGACGLDIPDRARLRKTPEPSYSQETRSSGDISTKSGEVTIKDTSRQKILNWNPITVPSGNGFAFSQRVSNLAVSIIEQKGGAEGKITTLYAASGTLVNKSEDDKHNGMLILSRFD